MNHSKEPWEVDDIGGLIGIRNKTNCAIATTGVNSLPQNQIDAERIVACVNACTGITTEALEAGVVHGVIESLRYLQNGRNGRLKTDTWMGVDIWEEESV